MAQDSLNPWAPADPGVSQPVRDLDPFILVEETRADSTSTKATWPASTNHTEPQLSDTLTSCAILMAVTTRHSL